MIEVSDLTKFYGPRSAIQNLNFTIGKGEIVGITGRLGSGRTELALTLFCMSEPDAGEIRMDGRALRMRTNRDAINNGIAYVSEDRLSLGLVMAQSIASNTVITVLSKLIKRFGLADEKRSNETVRKWIAELGIKVSDPANPVQTLSGGNQQRVVLAKWLATKPKLLILDSPTVGVDIAAKDGIYEIVRRHAEDGLGVIMISDEIPEVYCHSHRVLVMREGRISGEYSPLKMTEAELQEAVDA